MTLDLRREEDRLDWLENHMPTALQLKLIHVAARKVGLNDAQYRTLLGNVSGVKSSKDLDQAGFEDVMATLEDLGFSDIGHYPRYWRDKVERRGGNANARMVYKIKQMAQGGRYPIESLCRRFSDDRTGKVEELLPREAWKLIEALKAIDQRETGNAAKDAAVQVGTEPPHGRGTGQGCPMLF